MADPPTLSSDPEPMAVFTSLARRHFPLLGLTAAVFLAACTSTTTPDTDPDPDPATISVVISPTSATVQQGGSSTFDGTATLGGSFSGAVSFSVTGLPAGVTVTVGSVSTSGNTATATVTVAVAGSVAAGSYSGTVTASGSGVTATAAYSLTVTAGSSFTLSASPDPISIVRGATGDVTVTLARTSFTEAVTLAAEGLPANVTAAFVPAAPTGNTSTLTLTVGAGASPGMSTLTIRGTSSLADVTDTFVLTVTDPAPPSNLMLDFGTCEVDETPDWVAYSDGFGAPWMVAPGVSDVYDFSGLTQSVLGITVVVVDGADRDISVDYIDVSSLSGTVDACPPDGAKTVNGTAAGTVGLTSLSLGSSRAVVFADGPFSIPGVDDGPLPLVGYSVDGVGSSDRMLIRRDQDIADMGALGVVDFTTDGFAPSEATITIAGLGLGDAGAVGMDYAVPLAGGACSVSPLYNSALIGGTFPGRSASASEQMAGEFHVAGATISNGLSVRTVKEAFGTLADRTVDLPADLPVPVLTDVTGPANYLRLEAQFALPAEYTETVFFDYSGPNVDLTVYATSGILTGDVTLTMPDFSALAGWDDAWAIPPAATGVNYFLGASSGLDFLTGDITAVCSEGGRFVSSSLSGAYN